MGGCFSCFEGVAHSSAPAPQQLRQLEPEKSAPESTGRTRALLIGCNYFGTDAELAGCINDVRNVRELLIDVFHWWSDNDSMRILVDDGSGYDYPTRQSILSALQWLVKDAKAGDSLFLSYSGHGAQEVDPNGFEEDGMNETILPCDFEEAGMISDDVLTEILIQNLPEGVKFTSIMDCCHSGTGLDLAWTHEQARGQWREDTNPFHVAADVQMISGCTDEQTSADGAQDLYGRRSGALTTAFCDVVRSYYLTGIPYARLLEEMQAHIYSNGFEQNPQLTSSQAFNAYNRPFSLTQCQMNANEQLGRIFRRKFAPQPRPMAGPLADMLSDLGMLVLQEELLEAALGDGGMFDGGFSAPVEDDDNGGVLGMLGGMLNDLEDDF